MEIEYKWELPDGWDPVSVLHKGVRMDGDREIHMEAVYYDTPDGYVAGLKGALRLRREDGRSVCCLKIAEDGSAGRVRQEYEVEAGTIDEGLARLPSVGAPQEVCARVLGDGATVVCGTEFTRRAIIIEGGGWTGELAIDRGRMVNGERSGPIAEIELEFKSGDLPAFHSFAAKLQDEQGLAAIEKSKSQRAREL